MRINTSGVSGRPTMKSTARERTGADSATRSRCSPMNTSLMEAGKGLARLDPAAVQGVAPYVKQNQGAVLNGFGDGVIGFAEQQSPGLHTLQHGTQAIGAFACKANQGDALPGYRFGKVIRHGRERVAGEFRKAEQQVADHLANFGDHQRLFTQQLFGLLNQQGNMAVPQQRRAAHPLMQLARRARRRRNPISCCPATAGSTAEPSCRKPRRRVSISEPNMACAGSPGCGVSAIAGAWAAVCGKQLPHAGSQRGGVDGLADIVVTACVQGAFAVASHGAGGQRHHADGLGFRILFDAPGHFQTVHAGQLKIGENQLGPVVGQHQQSVFGTFRGADLVTLMGQQQAHQLQIHRCVVHDKNWCSSHETSMRFRWSDRKD